MAACDDGRWGYYGYRQGAHGPYSCERFTSCGSCTPVLGCGWCSFQGSGACVSDPDQCGTNQFSFTWEPSGCGPGATASDGGATSSDAAAPVDAAAPPSPSDARAPADARADGPQSDARADQ
ncbi:MAG TPA: hypothetical protein VH062_12940 [Polyangiaceae bacterium]|nr:hypothetical protein [Polyangiaceae bacterium]